ncbi:MAG: tetratricopeptide repeat protein [Megasphaera sp.]|jgi:tetratricopeptide (TPR) repeat protein|nr:tetratricopeptide repeat protein [Megasphaera sp.]
MNYPHFLCITLLAAILLAGCGTDTPKDSSAAPPAQTQQQAPAISAASEALYADGEKAYGQFDYDKAISLFDKAIAADKNNYKALSGKGVAMAMRGNSSGNKKDVTGGIALIQEALKLAPDYVPSFYDLALSYKINGQYDESIQWFQKVIAREPDNTWSYYGIATIYGDQGNARDALIYLKEAAALDNTNVKDAARTQSHFDKIRHTKEFTAWINE